jgi:hypothetical protein
MGCRSPRNQSPERSRCGIPPERCCTPMIRERGYDRVCRERCEWYLGKREDPERAGSEALHTPGQWACAAAGIPGGYSRYIMTCRGTGLFRALWADHTLFPGSLTRKLYKKKIPEMMPGVPGTKERELAEKWGMTHEMGGGVSR